MMLATVDQDATISTVHALLDRPGEPLGCSPDSSRVTGASRAVEDRSSDDEQRRGELSLTRVMNVCVLPGSLMSRVSRVATLWRASHVPTAIAARANDVRALPYHFPSIE